MMAIETSLTKERLKVLKTLHYQEQLLSISKIAEVSGMNVRAVRRVLRELIVEDLVLQTAFGRLVVHELNVESPKIQALVTVFTLWQ